jgi:hypothetical protein
MATAMDDSHSRENGLNETTGMVLTTSKKADIDDVPDYNEAFPQLRSAGSIDVNRSNTFFSSTFSSSSNGTNATGGTANTTTSLFAGKKSEEDRRRQLTMHASSVTTKIVSDH